MRNILILILFSNFIMAQSLPFDFSSRLGKLNAISDINPASNVIEDILVVNDTVWIATSKGLSKTGDKGNTWVNYYGEPDFEEESVSLVRYNNGTIWTATWHFEEINSENRPIGSGLKYSTDNGITWVTIDQPIDLESDTTIIYGNNVLKARPQTDAVDNFIYDIAFTSGTVWIASKLGGIRKSTDMGENWQRVVLPPDYFDEINPGNDYSFELSPIPGAFTSENNLNHQVFSLMAQDDNVLYVGTANGINKTTDGGLSWKKITHTNQQFPISGNHVLKIVYDSFSNAIWAATWKAVVASEYWGVSMSSDGGESWKTFLPDEKTHGLGFKYIYSGSSISDVQVFAATENGMFRTSNGGETWVLSPEIVDDITNVKLTSSHFRSIACNYNDDGSTDIWMGSLGGLVLLTEATGFWEGQWKVFITSSPVASVRESYVFPNPFHAGSGYSVTRFKYSTDGINKEITIRIFDFGMNLVRTVIQNVTRNYNSNDTPRDYWDGRDENSNLVPNGVYFYRIDIGSEDPLYGKILVLR